MSDATGFSKTRMQVQNIQALRGVAALLVLATHISGGESDYGGTEKLLPEFLNMGATGVDLFFLISGFIMVYVTHDAGPLKTGKLKWESKIKRSAEFLFRRVTRIYPLYWLVTIAMILLYAGKSFFFNDKEIITNYFSSFLLLPDEKYPIVPVGWTLVYEMYFYIVFSFFLLFHRKKLPVLLALWGGVVIIGTTTGLRGVGPWTNIIFSPLTFEFLLGGFIALLSLNNIHRYSLVGIFISTFILFLLLVLFSTSLYPKAVVDHTIRAMIFTLPYGLLLYAVVGIEWGYSRIAPDWLIKIGDASYSLYLTHVPLILIIGTLISRGKITGFLDNILLIVACLVGGINTALITHKWVEQPLTKIFARIGETSTK